MNQDDPRLLRLSDEDNVCVLLRAIPAGEEIRVGGRMVRLSISLGVGHKLATRPIRAGEKVIKYRVPIGSATQDIAVGEHVHLHNLKSDYLTTYTLDEGHHFSSEHHAQ